MNTLYLLIDDRVIVLLLHRKIIALAYWLQREGVRVIPTIEWSDSASLDWCMDGLPSDSVLAITTQGCFQNRGRLDKVLR